MSTEAAALEQSAPTPETTEAPFNAEAYEALTDARLSFAPQAEIDRLTALVSEPPKEPAPEPVIDTPTPEPEPAPEIEKEPPVAEVPEPATGEEPKPAKEDDELPERFRFKEADDRLVAQTAKTKKISLSAAAALLAGTPVSKEAEVIPDLPTTPEPAPEIKQMEDELATVRAKLKADKADGVLATGELDDLEDRRAVLIADIAQAKATAKASALVKSELSDAEFVRERNGVLRETVKDYPEMARTDSAQFRIAKAIGLEMRDPNHPDHARLSQPDGPRFIAEAAAKQLGLKPVTVEPPAPKPKAPVVKETPKPGPAPGSRTSAAPNPTLTAAQQAEQSEAQLQAVLEGRAAPPPRPVRNWA